MAPIGTEFCLKNRGIIDKFSVSKNYLVSFGSEKINGKVYIATECASYKGDAFWYVSLTDIERLAVEQGMILKELPKYWVVQCDTKHPDWMKVVDYMNTLSGGWTGKNNGDYYGFDGNRDHKGTNVWVNLRQFINNPTVLTIEEFVSLTNKKSENMVTIKREQLQEIHTIACSDWKTKITDIAKDQPFGDIRLADGTVDEMFRAATSSQLPVLEKIFGPRLKELNFESPTINAQVNGINIFGNSSAKREDVFIGLPAVGSTSSNIFYLNRDYKWTYDPASETLIVNRK
jgi:hypothetical protein